MEDGGGIGIVGTMLSQIHVVVPSHVRRISNQVANCLANEGVTCDPHLWDITCDPHIWDMEWNPNLSLRFLIDCLNLTIKNYLFLDGGVHP